MVVGFFFSFFRVGNSGCTKRTSLGKMLSGSFAKLKSLFFHLFLQLQQTEKSLFLQFCLLNHLEEKKKAMGHIYWRGKIKTLHAAVKIHVFNISCRRRCCRAHPWRCRPPPTRRRASWCRRPRYRRATWP